MLIPKILAFRTNDKNVCMDTEKRAKRNNKMKLKKPEINNHDDIVAVKNDRIKSTCKNTKHKTRQQTLRHSSGENIHSTVCVPANSYTLPMRFVNTREFRLSRVGNRH